MQGQSELRKVRENAEFCLLIKGLLGAVFPNSSFSLLGAVCSVGLKPGLKAISVLPDTQIPSKLTERNFSYFAIPTEFTHLRLSAQTNP